MLKTSKVKRKISKKLDIPKEVIFDVACIKLTGSTDLYIENHKGIIEYSEKQIRIKSKSGVLMVSGEELFIEEINEEELKLSGEIKVLEFLK